jgi:hypothetical protein
MTGQEYADQLRFGKVFEATQSTFGFLNFIQYNQGLMGDDFFLGINGELRHDFFGIKFPLKKIIK